MKELTKSEEQMMDIFWDSKEALTSVDIVKMQVKATWTNGLVHNIIRSLVQNGYLKECGMEQFGRQYARKLMPALTREEYIAKLMIQKSEGKSSVKQMVVALAKESEDMEQVIEELEETTNMSNQEFVKLNNGVEMPIAGIGTFMLSPDEAENSVISALQDGYRLIDTANAYVNEKVVGRAMKKSGIARENIFLETKLWPSFYEQEDAVEKTLKRLNTDYIDLLLIHQPAGNYIAGYRLMEKAYKEGKVKAIGLSNFTMEQIQEILDVCEVNPAVLQTEVHPYFQEDELKEFLAKEDIAIQAWYPLGHGDKALLEESVFTRLAEKYGKSNAQIILHWHIQAGNIVIPGSKNPDHIRANFELFDFALSDEEMSEIAALNKNKRYYTSTPEMLKAYAEMVPSVDEQK